MFFLCRLLNPKYKHPICSLKRAIRLLKSQFYFRWFCSFETRLTDETNKLLSREFLTSANSYSCYGYTLYLNLLILLAVVWKYLSSTRLFICSFTNSCRIWCRPIAKASIIKKKKNTKALLLRVLAAAADFRLERLQIVAVSSIARIATNWRFQTAVWICLIYDYRPTWFTFASKQTPGFEFPVIWQVNRPRHVVISHVIRLKRTFFFGERSGRQPEKECTLT